jgi:putative membrane protein (TIGR04086 family)
MAELSVIAIFFLLLFGAMLAGVPEVARPLSPLDYADAMVSSFVAVFFFALWVARRIESRFVLHGVLVGAFAMLLFIALNLALTGSFEEPPLYWVAHGLKLLGGAAGGKVAERRHHDAGSIRSSAPSSSSVRR